MGDARKGVTGRTNFLAGQAAEEAVVRRYEARGLELVQSRWRGKAGEIDLILKDANGLVFVEVKHSRTFERAAARLLPRQVQRIMHAAEEFAGSQPDGLLTEMRFDVALVNGAGDVHILENALWAI